MAPAREANMTKMKHETPALDTAYAAIALQFRAVCRAHTALYTARQSGVGIAAAEKRVKSTTARRAALLAAKDVLRAAL